MKLRNKIKALSDSFDQCLSTMELSAIANNMLFETQSGFKNIEKLRKTTFLSRADEVDKLEDLSNKLSNNLKNLTSSQINQLIPFFQDNIKFKNRQINKLQANQVNNENSQSIQTLKKHIEINKFVLFVCNRMAYENKIKQNNDLFR